MGASAGSWLLPLSNDPRSSEDRSQTVAEMGPRRRVWNPANPPSAVLLALIRANKTTGGSLLDNEPVHTLYDYWLELGEHLGGHRHSRTRTRVARPGCRKARDEHIRG